MSKCKAPQTREYWNDLLSNSKDANVLSQLRAAHEGWLRHKNTSRHHWHDWTIYRNCCIREARKRGLDTSRIL